MSTNKIISFSVKKPKPPCNLYPSGFALPAFTLVKGATLRSLLVEKSGIDLARYTFEVRINDILMATHVLESSNRSFTKSLNGFAQAGDTLSVRMKGGSDYNPVDWIVAKVEMETSEVVVASLCSGWDDDPLSMGRAGVAL